MCILFLHIKTLNYYYYTCMLSKAGPRISGKGAHMFKGAGISFADFISFFLNSQ